MLQRTMVRYVVFYDTETGQWGIEDPLDSPIYYPDTDSFGHLDRHSVLYAFKAFDLSKKLGITTLP